MVTQNDHSAAQAPAPKETKLRFADGTVAWMSKGSAFDFVFEATFLKFFTIAVVIVGTLFSRADIRMLNDWEQVAVWALVMVTWGVWFLVAISILIAVRKFWDLPAIYTPFVTLPGIPLNELTVQYTIMFFNPLQKTSLEFDAGYIIQPVIVVILFDIIFGSFVAAHHPFLRTEKSFYRDETPETTGALQAAPLLDDDATHPPDEVNTKDDVVTEAEEEPSAKEPELNHIQVAGRTIDPATLVSLEIQDHYLRVETLTQNYLARYKLRDAVNEMDPELGIQVNRSTWVAGAQISMLSRSGSNQATITMKNGVEFSVSRSKLSAVRLACDRWGIKQARLDA